MEVVRAYGPDVFDEVPDRFNLRELVQKEYEVGEEIKERLNNI